MNLFDVVHYCLTWLLTIEVIGLLAGLLAEIGIPAQIAPLLVIGLVMFVIWKMSTDRFLQRAITSSATVDSASVGMAAASLGPILPTEAISAGLAANTASGVPNRSSNSRRRREPMPGTQARRTWPRRWGGRSSGDME